MNKVFFLVLFLVITGFSRAQSVLPESRPSDLKIAYSETKESMNSYKNLYLTGDTCYYETIFQDITNRFTFKLTSSELNVLYKILKGFKADKITSKLNPSLAPERAGDNLFLQWKNSSVLITNSGSNKIEEKWQPDWEKIVSYLKNLAKAELDKKARDFVLRFDKSIAGRKITLYLNEELLYENIHSKTQEETLSETVSALPGTYYLKVVVDKPDIAPAFKIQINENKTISFLLKSKTLIVR